MRIEIDFGDRFGTLTFEKKLSRGQLLHDLLKDRNAISGAIDRYADDKELVDGLKYRGNPNIAPPAFLIASLDDEEGKFSRFREPNNYRLFVDEEGSLREYTKGSIDWSLSPFHLPEWFTSTVTRDQLDSYISEKFYPKKAVSEMLTKIVNDKRKIKNAFVKFSIYPDMIRKQIGDLPERLKILSHKDESPRAKLDGYSLIMHTLSVSADGTIFDEIKRFPHKSRKINLEDVGRVSQDDQTATIDAKYPPDWTTDININYLRAVANAIFYS